MTSAANRKKGRTYLASLLCALGIQAAPVQGQTPARFLSQATKTLVEAEKLAKQNKLGEAQAQYEKALALNPTFITAYERYAFFLYHQKKYQHGIKVLKKGLKANPQSLPLRAFLGMHLFQLGRIREAYQHFRKAATSQQHRYEIQALYARAALLIDAYAGAILALQSYLENRPLELRKNDYIFQIMLARALLREGRLAEAASLIRQVVKLHPRNLTARAVKAELQLHQNKCKDAATTFNDIISRAKAASSKHLHVLLGKAYFCMKRYDEAIKTISVYLDSQTDQLNRVMFSADEPRRAEFSGSFFIKNGLKVRGEAALYLGRASLALADFQKVEFLTTGDEDTIINIAKAYFQLKQYDKVQSKLSSYLRQPNPKASILILALRAALKRKDKQGLSLALNYAKQLINRKSPNSSDYYYAGIAYKSAGRFTIASELLRQSIRLTPTFEPAQKALFTSYLFRSKRLFLQGHYQESLKFLRKAEKLRPHSATVHRHLAILYLRIQNYPQALVHAKAMRNSDPQHPVANRLVGRALAALNRHQEALNAYRIAIKQLVKSPNLMLVQTLTESAVSFVRVGNTVQALEDLALAQSFVQKLSVPVDSPLHALIQRNQTRARLVRAMELLERGRITATEKILRDLQASADSLSAPEKRAILMASLISAIQSRKLHRVEPLVKTLAKGLGTTADQDSQAAKATITDRTALQVLQACAKIGSSTPHIKLQGGSSYGETCLKGVGEPENASFYSREYRLPPGCRAPLARGPLSTRKQHLPNS